MTAVALKNGLKLNLGFPREARKDRASECTFHLVNELMRG